MTANPHTLRVDIWSDIICPFCWIGKRQFEIALKDFAGRDQVEVHHHAFRLSPDQPVTPVIDMLQLKYRMTPEQVVQNQARVVQMAASVGLDYHLENTLNGDTLKAHRLIKLAEDHGLAAEMIERLYRANFTEEQSLFDDAVLVALAAEVGLEAEAVTAFLKTDRYADTVREEQEFITSRGAQGVPFFVLNNRYALSGAQSPEAFTQALESAWKDIAPQITEGEVCGPDGCEI
ncbi:DsbA family oxidoreductase [Asticcacaulis sp. ZE23SCel15]|uniref:DsbA family oxidoreductase n=1 Tax=Asticcacaulis sp. ZE23SCel15 TaxID=3059027 RepID=UPI00265D74EB|nr:DsbA family oxidoreductase [Asticcacaulis sp. ZE23SCel15]WKL58712.1 DsbA family oxidoreductase [Asticcacaulis sp. ZE23SCel15]